MRISVLMEFNESIGPLLRIVFKMSQDFMNFMIIFFMLIVMFGVVGNLNFMGIEHFENFYESMLTVIDFAIGNFNFKFFDKVDDPTQLMIGYIWTICIVVFFNIMLLNLLLAILSNTYNIFDSKSNGLFLAKILSS